MYDRRYDDKVLSFEASGALKNASLVMRDRETDSWWHIISGDAIGGKLKGTPLKELPVSEKTQWKDWKKRYPNTKVLSVDGIEHETRDPYQKYFEGSMTFRDLTAKDDRLFDKASIYGFQLDDTWYAVPHESFEGGATFRLDNGKEVFLYRGPGWAILASTFAYVAEANGKSARFRKTDGRWVDAKTGAEFSEEEGFVVSEDMELAKLGGFDTFWYIWAETHDAVRILK